MQSRTGPMDDRDLAAIIDAQITEAIDYDGHLNEIRDKALKYFEGDESLAGDAEPQPNRSRVISRDMSDVHGWIMPSLLRVFLSSDRIAEYEPRRQDAEDAARQATDYVNYVFLSECNGYAVLHAGLWDGLTFGNGVIKHWWDDTPAYSIESLSGIPEARFIELVSSDDVTVLEHTARPDTSDAPMMPREQIPALEAAGATPAGMMALMGPEAALSHAPDIMGEFDMGVMPSVPLLHDLKIRRKLYDGCLKVAAVPAEQFRIDRNATILDEDHVRFCAHVEMRTRSSLIQEGYPREIIDNLPAIAGTDSAPRFGGGDVVAADRSTELIEVWECYLLVDYDGDGIAEWRQVITVNGASEWSILHNEEWGDDLPFSDLVPDPMPHRWRGGSLFEEIGDIQRIKTVLWRGLNDNLYWTNNPQRLVIEGKVSPSSQDELRAPTFGGVIMGSSVDAVTNLAVPFVADKLLGGIEFCDRVREFRTGVSSATMSLDPEALANQTATAVNAAKTSSYSKTETYARNIAEYGGLKRMFKCLLKLLSKHQDKPRVIRLRGEWEEIDPRGWDADMDVVVNVGLGSGSRDRDLAVLQAVSQKQELVVSSLGPIVSAQLGIGPDVIFSTYRKMVEASGLKSPQSYFPEITKEQIQQIIQQVQGQESEKPDPKMAEAQARIAAMQEEAQVKAQMRVIEMQMDRQHAQEKTEREIEVRYRELEMQAQAQLREIDMKNAMDREAMMLEHERELERIRANAAAKIEELKLEAELKREAMLLQPNVSPNIPQAERDK